MMNEVPLKLGGKELKLRATFEAVCNIERDLGKTWSQVGEMVVAGSYGVRDLAIIIFHGIAGFGDTRHTLSEVGEMVMQDGMNAIIGDVLPFVSIAFRGTKNMGKSDEKAAPEPQPAQ